MDFTLCPPLPSMSVTTRGGQCNSTNKKSFLHLACLDSIVFGTYDSVWKRVWWGKSWWKTTWKVEVLVLFLLDSITCQDFDRWHTHGEIAVYWTSTTVISRFTSRPVLQNSRNGSLSLILRIISDCHPSSLNKDIGLRSTVCDAQS